MGDLGVKIEALPAFAAALLGREHLQTAHHLQTVGQLNEDYARVLGVGDDQVAEVLGLLARYLERDFRNIRQPERDAQHLLAEAFADLGGQGAEILPAAGEPHHVVQHRGDGRVAPQPDLGDDDCGHRRVVVEQRRAVVTELAFEPACGVFQRLVQQAGALLREILAGEPAQPVVSGEFGHAVSCRLKFMNNFKIYQVRRSPGRKNRADGRNLLLHTPVPDNFVKFAG